MTKLNLRTPTLLLGVSLLLLAGVLTAWLLQGQREARRWVLHTTQVREQLADYRMAVMRTEIATRGYLLTGSPADLTAFETSSRQIAGKFAAVRRLVADNPQQERRLQQLDILMAERLRVIHAAVGLQRQGGTAAAVAMIDRADERERTTRLGHMIETVLAEEVRLDALRRARAAQLEEAEPWNDRKPGLLERSNSGIV